MSGKAYLARKNELDRPVGDFYSTPKSLVDVLLKNAYFDPKGSFLEPCSGDNAIVEVLQGYTQNLTAFDLLKGEVKQDFLTYNKSHDYIITNPPFSLWDAFVQHGKKLARRRVAVIGRLNYFATTGRFNSDIWDGLSEVLVFSRMVDYRTPKRDDGLFHVAGLVTAWFIFDKMAAKADATIKVVDVQQWAKLGQLKE